MAIIRLGNEVKINHQGLINDENQIEFLVLEGNIPTKIPIDLIDYFRVFSIISRRADINYEKSDKTQSYENYITITKGFDN